MKQSSFLKLNWADLAKGLVLAVIVAVGGAVTDLANSGAMPTPEQWATIGGIAWKAAAAYIVKQFISNSSGVPLKKEQ